MMPVTGLATGIGSLPQQDVDEAIGLIANYLTEIPFWPQLPKRDSREGMVAQYSEGFPFLRLSSEGVRFVRDAASEAALEEFYANIIAGDLDAFRISQQYAAGLYGFLQKTKDPSFLKKAILIKGQTTGPFTLAASLKDDKGSALLFDPVIMQALVKGLAMKALWQLRQLASCQKKIVLFIDEPYLGCFGSAYTPITREEAVRVLSDFCRDIKSQQEVFLGVHCCGNTDWSILTEIKEIDIINFDAYDFSDRFVLYASDIQRFIARGGLICWGIVPTQGVSGLLTPHMLVTRIAKSMEVLEKKGVDGRLLRQQLLISPACGLGTLLAAQAKEIFSLLAETSALIRKNP